MAAEEASLIGKGTSAMLLIIQS